MAGSTLRIQKAYDEWSENYDGNKNPTRDLNYKATLEESLELTGKKCWKLDVPRD